MRTEYTNISQKYPFECEFCETKESSLGDGGETVTISLVKGKNISVKVP